MSVGAQGPGVLAGELTYRVIGQEAVEPAGRIRGGTTRLSGGRRLYEGDRISFRVAATGLAALLVRAAADASLGGRNDAASASEARRRLDTRGASLTIYHAVTCTVNGEPLCGRNARRRSLSRGGLLDRRRLRNGSGG